MTMRFLWYDNCICTKITIKPGLFQIHASSVRPDRTCARCGVESENQRDVITSTYKEEPTDGVRTELIFDRIRYRCSNCNIIFQEPLHFMHENRRMTKRAVQYVRDRFAEGKMSIAKIGFSIGAAPTVVAGIRDEII